MPESGPPIWTDLAPPDEGMVDILADLDCIAWRRELRPDGSLHYPWISPNATRILGFAPEALTVGPGGALSVVHWADRDTHAAAIHASAAALAPCRVDFRVVTAGDETRWLRESARPRRLGDGRVVWDGLWQDNTRSVRAEFQHQTLMEHAQDCIFLLADDERVTWCNAAAQRVFGLGPGEAAGLPFAELTGPGEPSPLAMVADEAGAADRPLEREMTGRRRDGSRFPFDMTVSELRRDGRLSVIVIGRDITRRRDAERRMADSERRLRLTFITASLGIVVMAMDGTILFSNPAFETMVGDGSHPLVGTNLHDLVSARFLPPPARIPPAGMSFALVCDPGLPDGAERHWRITGTRFPAKAAEDEPSLLLFVEDVTEATRDAHERRQLAQLLYEGQKLEALGRLAGGVAHELNNMLGPILMGAEMIARTARLDPRNDERCARIISAAKNSREIVRNVLAYCRKESHAVAPFDVTRAFDDFTAMAVPTLPPTIRVEIQREPAALQVTGEPGQLQQVLLNLVNNARDAMEGRGTLTLGLRRLAPAERAARIGGADAPPDPLAGLAADGDHVEISVADTGCGMDEATRARIFDPFFTTKPVGQGTGLGLSVVQGIVKSMGGAIAVESGPGAGSRFRLVLPLVAD
ncbi:PAS domain S-box protein [Phaeospirillum tilakii]|uniref:histidine kinase n=1 Tax=Phaeospirillum tilakii TaxID=741673 RepID=A0ABW5C998_9PROT